MRHQLASWKSCWGPGSLPVRPAVDAAPLEDRIMLSASPAAAAVLIGGETDLALLPGQPSDVSTLDVSHRMGAESEAPSSIESPRLTSPAAESPRVELVFVDAAAQDHEQLVADILVNGDPLRDLEVYLLDAERDGIEQISEILDGHEDVAAVHLVSHGAAGQIRLGDTWLTHGNLASYSNQIAGWNSSLRDGADLLFYGCNLAASHDGRALAEALGALCDCDVAASSDDTGQTALGGDWDFEFVTGPIETGIAFSNSLQQQWGGLFKYATYRDEFNSLAYDNTNGSQDWSGTPWVEIGESNGPTAGNVQVFTAFGEQGLRIWQSGKGAVRRIDLSAATTAFLSFDYARFGLDGASDFIVLEISPNNGTSWVELDRFQGPANDTSLKNAGYDISAFAGSATQIRFVSSGINATESLFVDDLQVSFSTEQLSIVNEFLVNDPEPPAPVATQKTSSESRGSQNAVALAADGSYVVVWSEGTAGNRNVYARRFAADGTALTAELPVNQNAGGNDQRSASVVSDYLGNFVVTWTSNQSGNDDVYYRRFSSNGTPIDVERVANVTTTNRQGNSVIAMDSTTGDFVIAWEGEGLADLDGVYFRRFGSDGTEKDAADRLVNQAAVNAEKDPSIAMINNGGFVVVWEREAEDRAYFQRFAADGSPLGAATYVDGVGARTTAPAVASDAAGNFTVVYRDNFISPGIWRRGFFADGTERYGFSRLIAGNADSPSIAMAADGSHVVVYQKTTADLGVFGQWFSPDGSLLGGEFLVNQTTANDQSQASVALHDVNNFVVAWHGNGVGDTAGVFARQFSTLPTGLVISTSGNVGSGGSPGLDTWDEEDVLLVSDPNFALGPDPATNGTFSLVFDPLPFGSNANINGLHYVRNTLTVGGGGGATEFTLRAGDLLITIDGGGSQTYTGLTTSITVEESDVFVYRPYATGVYAVGDFFYLLDNPLNDNIRGIGLVESPLGVQVGDGPVLPQGTFLLSERDSGEHDNIYTYLATNIGNGTTTSAAGKEILIDGENGDLNFTDQVQGIHLIESDIDVGGVSFEAGDLLITLNNDHTIPPGIGSNNLSADRQDIFQLRMTETEQGPNTRSLGTAAIVFDGSSVNLDDTGEDLDALTLTFGGFTSTDSSPMATNMVQSKTYVEGAASVALDDIVVTDPDIGETITAQLTLNNVAAGALTTGTFGTVTSTYNGGSGLWQATGSITDVNAALAAVAFIPATQNDIDTAITTHIEDQAGTAPADGAISLEVTPENDPPQATNLTQNKSYTEGAASVSLDDIVVSEFDTDPAQTITARLTVAAPSAGVLTTGTFGAVTSSYNAGSGVWQAIGNLVDVNAALAAVSFTPAAQNDADTTITTHVEDQDAAGPADGTIALSVTPQNDAPQATNLTQNKAYIEGAASVALDDIVVSEFDTTPAQTITARLTLANTASGALTTGTFGSVTSSYNAVSGIWQAVGNITDVNAALADVAFVPATQNDVGTSVSTHIEDQDGAGPADGTITLDVTPVNDAPQATNLTQTKVYLEGAPSVALDDIVVSEFDTNPAQTITARLTLANTAAGTLTTGTFGLVTSTYNPLSGVWQAIGSLADVNAALAGVAFSPAAQHDTDSTIATHIEDQSGNGPADGLITLDVTPQNDPPQATNLSQNKNYVEGAASVALDDIVVTEIDSTPAQTVLATLTLANTAAGSLSTGNFGALTSSYNSGSGIWAANGSVADVNAALAAVAFLPAPNNDVATTITSRIEDQDSVGPPDGTINLTVIPQNDPPTATNLNQVKAYVEGAALVALDDIVVADVDTNPGQIVTARLTLNDTSTGALTAASGNGELYLPGTGVWTVTGSIGQVNAALAAVAFVPISTNDVDTAITTHVEDQDSVGPLDGTITLDVTAVNNPPTLTAFAGPVATTPEETEVEISFADLAAQGDESDVDGSVEAFVVTGNGNGSLKIGATAATATAWDASTNATVDATRSAYWTPALDMTGTLNALTVVAVDDAGAPSANQVTARVNVTNVNDRPIAVPNQYTVSAEDILIVPADGVLRNDRDVDGDPLTAVLISGPLNGTLILKADGGFTYTPRNDFSGSDSFVYAAHDGSLNSAPATVRITVTPIAGPPPVTPPAPSDPPPETDPPPEPEPPQEESSTENSDNSPVGGAGVTPPPSQPSTERGASGRSGVSPATSSGVESVSLLARENRTADGIYSEPLLRLDRAVRAVRTALAPDSAGAFESFVVAFDAGLLWDDLSELKDELQQGADTPMFAAGSAAGVTSTLTVGYVLWTIRSGWLATSLLAQMPAWRIVDPLVVLDYLDDETGGGKDEDDSLESMLDKSNEDQAESGDEEREREKREGEETPEVPMRKDA